MKIDFDMLEKLAEAGTPASGIIMYLRMQHERKAPRRAADKVRKRAAKQRNDAESERKAAETETPQVELTASQIAERELYARGKQLCGNRAGGLISRLLQHHGYDFGAARRIIEVAATKNDPREYIVGSMRSKNGSGNATMDAFDDLLARTEGGEVEGEHRLVDVTPRRAQGG